MYRNQEEHREFFWTGFFAGAVLGGTLGVLFASEAGKRAYRQLETTVQDLQSRFNGKVPAQDPQVVRPRKKEEKAEDHSE
ncbi:MAG: YtxH domain-containing protein [bacterium]|nr:YtxH domain-containing protein [bacterium]